MGVKRFQIADGTRNLPTSKVLFSSKVRAWRGRCRSSPSPGWTCWWGVGVPGPPAGAPHPPAAKPTGPPTRPPSAPGPGEAVPLPRQTPPRSTCPSPVVVNQLDHLLHHILAHLAVNVSLLRGWVLLLKGQENTATQSLASPLVLLL